jgi:eukaryotic translation initiation factor 2C
VRRLFYTNDGAQSLYGGIEAWKGYFQSIRPTPGKIMINVDLSTTAFYESCGLVQMVVKVLGKRSVEDLRRITDRDRAKIDKALKNLKIYVTHRGENASKRRLKITKISNTSASNTKFEIEGRQTDVASYFERTYNRRLQYPFLPCVIVRKSTLPMEVCNVIEVCKNNMM